MQLYSLSFVNTYRRTPQRGEEVNCRRVKNRLSDCIDGELDIQDRESIQFHLDRCPNCSNLFKSIKEIQGYCSGVEPLELPEGFHERLWQKIYVKEEVKVFKNKRGLRIGIGVAAALLVVVIGVGTISSLLLGGSKSAAPQAPQASKADMVPGMSPEEAYDAGMDGFFEEPAAENKESGFTGGSSSDSAAFDSAAGEALAIDRKIIKSAYLGIETLEFDKLNNNLQGKVAMMGGYIESSSTSGVPRAEKSSSPDRQAHYEIRIPSKKFEQFINEVGELGNLITKEIGGEDVTGQYFDVQARIKSLTIQEERLLSILKKAELLQDIIELEGELARVRYDIENYTGTLKSLDSMVSLSRVSLDIYEVKEIKTDEPDPETLGDRIADAFKGSLKSLGKFFEGLTVFLVAALPYLAIIAPIIWIVWALWVRSRKNRNKREGNDG